MTVYRMAFKVGSQGHDHWPECFRHGIAAIGYGPLAQVDLSDIDLSERRSIPGHVINLWDELSPSQKASLRHVVCDFKKGDVIYAKSGKRIVGKGHVLGPYRCDSQSPIVKDGFVWPHLVRVQWEPDFKPVEILLGSEQTTVLELSGARLRKLEEAIRSRRHLPPFSPPDRQVEQTAVCFVRSWYEREGWSVESVETQRCGYDLKCTKGTAWKAVEVKGTRRSEQLFSIIRGEVVQARDNPQFTLCVVTSALSDQPQLFRYSGLEFLDRFDLVAESYVATFHNPRAGEEGVSAGKSIGHRKKPSKTHRHFAVRLEPPVIDADPPVWRELVEGSHSRRRFKTGDTIWIIAVRDGVPFLSRRVFVCRKPLPSTPNEVALYTDSPVDPERRIDDLALVSHSFGKVGDLTTVSPQPSLRVEKLTTGSAGLLKERVYRDTPVVEEPMEDEASPGSSENRQIEQNAVEMAVAWLARHGWEVESVEQEYRGYDLHCTKGPATRCVEVKGVKGPQERFVITAAELQQARENRHFVLFVVTSALSGHPHLSHYRGPEFTKNLGLVVRSYRAVLRV